MNMQRGLFLTAMAAFVWTACAGPDNAEANDDDALDAALLEGFEWRSIGPALMSGRIADIEIVPDDPATWYVGVGSGGVWKTENAGTTWTPLFDDQNVYSIGEIALSPHNPHEVWVGSGENHGGRHIGFGDGVYRSSDGGENWDHLGLENSDHISKIIVHPDDPMTVFVASQGPLWSEGGDRGVYKTTDGGTTWTAVLTAGPWTGVTELVMDPSHPDRLYAATWQRHRTVAGYIGGGPESGLHVSEDGGETWTELTQGLPKGNMGKIGLAISPQNPDRLYAAIELDRREGGIWMSDNRGASWTKQSDAVSGGTGPHYYQELYANPHKEGQIYLLSNNTQISDDHGKTFRFINNKSKHVDDHALAFRPDDPNYVMIGSDGGLYESYENGDTWRFINNLPITQFYKVAVDDAEPFYTVYGGTQDNNSQGGPSRTLNHNGIRNDDWFITLGGDGHQSAIEPGNPDIMYAQWQQGNLVRVDRTTGERVYIKPHAAPGEPYERWNWDAPIFVSQHAPERLYFSSQRVWRSDDRGDSWTAISGDLTKDEDRMMLPAMGRQWSWDAGWDYLAMSVYNTITSFGESPFDENLLYTGTDDGIIQITEDGGATWRRVNVGSLPGVPQTAFVNDIRADLHDPDTVYVALDNHKYGDYTPYILKSENRGRSWTSLAESLPEKHLVWRIVQDHKVKDLMFLATEFGLFTTVDGGESWVELDAGMPTIALRDVTLQRREDDVVAASFGRGFYILDDYSPLRDVTPDALSQEAALWPGRRAWWYIEESPLGQSGKASQGDGYFVADNPEFGAMFTYYLKEDIQSLEDIRQAAEKDATEAFENTPFPGFDKMTAEITEEKPEILLIVRDAAGNVVNRLSGPTKKGFHRVAWDLQRPASEAITSPDIDDSDGYWSFQLMVTPGTYTVELVKRTGGQTTQLAAPEAFEVEALRKGVLAGADPAAAAAFWQRLQTLQARVSAVNTVMSAAEDKLAMLNIALRRSGADSDMHDRWSALKTQMDAAKTMLRGNAARNAISERQEATISDRMFHVMIGVGNSTYGPTATHLEAINWAEAALAEVSTTLKGLTEETMPAFEADLTAQGAPYVSGGVLPPQ